MSSPRYSPHGPQLSFPEVESWPRSVPGLLRPRAQARLRRRSGRDNFFWAAQPDESATQNLLELGQRSRKRYGLRGRVFDRWRFHVSLVGLSEYFDSAPDAVAFSEEAASRIKAAPFIARFGRALTFASHDVRKPFVLAADGEHQFGPLLQAQLGAMQLNVKKAHFTPHVTMLYDEKVIPAHAVEPIEWTVNEFVLIQSHVGQGRPYTVLGRWRLNP